MALLFNSLAVSILASPIHGLLIYDSCPPLPEIDHLLDVEQHKASDFSALMKVRVIIFYNTPSFFLSGLIVFSTQPHGRFLSLQ